MSTEGWPSSAVEKISEALVGMVVLRSIILVMTPPMVSTPSDSGVTSMQQDALDGRPVMHAALDGSAVGNDLVGVHGHVGLALPVMVLDELL